MLEPMILNINKLLNLIQTQNIYWGFIICLIVNFIMFDFEL